MNIFFSFTALVENFKNLQLREIWMKLHIVESEVKRNRKCPPKSKRRFADVCQLVSSFIDHENVLP